MNLLCVGSANQYAKNRARQTQWELKKRNGDFNGHAKSLGDYVNFTKASSVLPRTDERDTKLSAIMTKAQAGRKLSYDEWEYLRVKNPTLHAKLKEIEKEQEAYEEALKRCKTRDDARRLHMSKLGEIMSAAKEGDESAIYRLNRMTRTMTEFTKSETYRKMPTEAEEAIARESERQAEREALRAEAAVKEAEKEAASEAEEESASESETVAETETSAKGEAVAETDADAVAEAKTKAERDAVAEAKTKAERDAVAETKRGAVVGTDAKTVRRPHRGEGQGFGQNKAVPAENAFADASGVSVGQRAYLNQRDGDSRRRRTVDAKA